MFTVKLICAFVYAYAKFWFPDDGTHLSCVTAMEVTEDPKWTDEEIQVITKGK